MTILIIIVLVVVLCAENNSFNQQRMGLMMKIKSLEKELARYKEKYPELPPEDIQNNPVQDNVAKSITPAESISTSHPIPSQKVEDSQKNVSKDTEGIRNKFILMTGATLIVLAAIVFLTSTWQTIPDVVKTCVIMLLTGVFVGASYIAKKVFKLEETSNTFLFIALTYLPISLFSISLFGLIGDYLSITGDGNRIYFSITAGLLAILYFIIGKNLKKISLFHASMIMQLVTTIFVSLSINLSFNAVILGIALYTTIMLLVMHNFLKEFANILNVYTSIYIYFTFIIGILLLLNESLIIDTITNAVLIINLCLKYKQKSNYLNRILILTQTLIWAISILNTREITLSINVCQIIFFILLIAMYITCIVTKKTEWKIASMIVVETAMVLLYISTLALDAESPIILKSYMIISAIAILNIANYCLSDKKNLFINLIPISAFVALINIIVENNLSINLLVLSELAIFTLSILNLPKNEKSNLILQTYSNVFTLLSTISAFVINEFMLHNTIIFIFLVIAYTIGYIRNTDTRAYKFIAYFILNIALLSAFYNLDLLHYSRFILVTTTTIIILIESYVEKTKKDADMIYLSLSFVATFVALNLDIDLLSFVSILTLDALFILHMRIKQHSNSLLILPFVSLLPSIYFSNWAQISNLNVMIFANLILITITSLLSVRKEKINIYTIFSVICILLQTCTFGFSVYINLVIAVLWSVWHMLKMSNEKVKFEILLYILGLLLHICIVKDVIETYIFAEAVVALKYLGYIVFSICITRNILKKHSINEYKIFEYLIFTVLYLTAISQYSSPMDGVIFVGMLVCLIILSYIKKFGPIFFTSTIAVLLNTFLLTREFWFSIPWWIYMLVIGSILIGFAVKNELTESKQKELLKSKIKSFTEHLDM